MIMPLLSHLSQPWQGLLSKEAWGARGWVIRPLKEAALPVGEGREGQWSLEVQRLIPGEGGRGTAPLGLTSATCPFLIPNLYLRKPIKESCRLIET